MKREFCVDIADGAVLVLGVSDEDRCVGVVSRMGSAMPISIVAFNYGGNKIDNLMSLNEIMADKFAVQTPTIVDCMSPDPIARLRLQIEAIQAELSTNQTRIVLDFSVIPRGDLWMVLRWINDTMLWDRVSFVYTEPEDYSSVKGLPLSSGLRKIQTLPGEAGLTDCSRPVHLLMQLGYEGDQALAVYEEVQPARTTLLIPAPPFRPEWDGRTESFNSQLLDLVGDGACRRIDAIDPEATVSAVKDIVAHSHADESAIVCPLGTKPQLLGLFAAVLQLPEQAAVLIPTPLRSASTARACGVGRSWVVAWQA